MAVFRVNKTKDFTVMSNSHFKDRAMSWRAKGLLSVMLSLPDEWDYSVRGLVSLSKDGKDSTTKALLELEELGYVKRTRATDSGGRFAGYDYDIYEVPQTEKPLTEKPLTGTPSTEKPKTEKPLTENPPQLNTNTLTTNQSNTDGLSTDVVKAAPDYDNLDDMLVPFKGLMLSENQMGDLLDKMGLDAFDEYVFRLQAFLEDNPRAVVKSHYATILKWYNEDRGVEG